MVLKLASFSITHRRHTPKCCAGGRPFHFTQRLSGPLRLSDDHAGTAVGADAAAPFAALTAMNPLAAISATMIPSSAAAYGFNVVTTRAG